MFCSGKIYYDLLERKEKDKANHIAIIRLEQLYPFPEKQFQHVLSKYNNTADCIWVQEEPENMGAWSYLLRTVKGVTLKLISRPESASPATGSHHAHEREQSALIEKSFLKEFEN
jgi:2-oxoglutarate dehydrogenase E1 component